VLVFDASGFSGDSGVLINEVASMADVSLEDSESPDGARPVVGLWQANSVGVAV
jgi:hypothetical protein